jgi:uncharacterized membrane protein YdfJ with MMPL/SSD domain
MRLADKKGLGSGFWIKILWLRRVLKTVIHRAARAPVRYPKQVVVMAIIVTVVATSVGWSAPGHMSYRSGDFYSHDSESFRTEADLEGNLPKRVRGIPTLAVISRGSPETAGARIARKLDRSPLIAEVAEKIFSSRNGRSSYVLAWLKGNDEERQESFAVNIAQEFKQPGVAVGGPSLVGHEFKEQIAADLRRAQVIAIPLLILLGLWVFRGFVAALLPVALGCFALVIVLGILRGATELLPISVFSLNIALALALGLGVDYSLLMLSRFREALAAGHAPKQSAVEMMRAAGKTVAISSIAIAASSSALLVVPIPFVRSVAFGGGLVAIITGLGALVVLPALLVLLGHRVNALAPPSWQRSIERAARPREKGVWYRTAQIATRRPLLVALLVGAGLIVLTIPVFSIRFTGFDLTALPSTSNPRRFAEKAQKEFENPLVGEVVIAIHGDKEMASGVTGRVNKLAERTHLGIPFPFGFQHAPKLWQVRLNPTSPVFSANTRQLVSRLRRMNLPITVGGETSAYIDSASLLRQKLPYVVAIVVLSSLFFVFLATGSLVLAVKTLIMNVLSLGAALGLVVFVFQDGRLESILDYTSQGALIVTLPLVVAVAAFGLLTDYGLFLLMRIKEERERGISDRKAIALGLERTGRIITAAAFLFCIAVGAFSTSGLLLLKVSAIAIVLTIAIDAFLVRPLLVPSLMAILGRFNWWPRTMPGQACEKTLGGTGEEQRLPNQSL